MKFSPGFSLLYLILFIKYGFLATVQSEPILEDDVLALKAFKQAISEDPLSKLSDWSTLYGDPCSWFGVTCSQNHVFSIRLSNSSLKGFLAPEVGMLNSLHELVLDHNLLAGTIPKQIGKLKNLQLLDLSENNLQGPIPPEIGGLTSISKMNLQSNELTGSIPSELGNLISLVELRLGENELNGMIPGCNISMTSSRTIGMHPLDNNNAGLCNLSQLKVADFSCNFFIGKMPSCLNYLPRYELLHSKSYDVLNLFLTELISSVGLLTDQAFKEIAFKIVIPF